jgi:citrate lyase beta subunit
MFRSLLYVPADNSRALDKVASLKVDGVIVDLEDAVSALRKCEARESLANVLSSVDPAFLERLIVRINDLHQGGLHDLMMLAESGRWPRAVLVPKVCDEDGLAVVRECLRAFSAPCHVKLWAMLETPQMLQNLDNLKNFSIYPLEALVLGHNDLSKDLGWSDAGDFAPMNDVRIQMVLAAKAHGLMVFDGVHNRIDDLKGLEEASRFAKAIGFDGKTIIHPKQIEVVHHAFAPTEDELTLARGMIEAYRSALEAGRSVALYHGQLVEALHVTRAQALLERNDAA